MRVIAIARELQHRGHEVAVLAGAKQSSVFEQYHLEFIELPPVPQMGAGLFTFGPKALDDNRLEEIMARMKEIVPQMVEAEKKVIGAIRPDVMLCGSFTGATAAKAFSIPAAMVLLQPHGEKTINFLSGRPGVREQLARFLEAADLLILEGMPELDGLPNTATQSAFASMKVKVRYTGPLPPDPPDSLPGQEELKIRHTGTKEHTLVYVTIGGGTPLIGEEFLKVCLDAFRMLPNIQGVFSTGLAIDPQQLAAAKPPANVIVRGFVPGTELIKASDVTVFHGGSSTLMTCIACGRPAVVVPSMAEQEDNGAVLATAGAGIVLDKKTLTSTTLKDAIQKITSEETFFQNARRLQELGTRYGGAPAAATMVEELLKRGNAS